MIDSEDADMNLCMNCHQGRASTVGVNKLTKGLDDDTVSDKLRFQNVHYFAAGATRFGTEAKGAYEYDGKKPVWSGHNREFRASAEAQKRDRPL